MFKITNKQTKIALDIQDLTPGIILDSLLENGGEVFKTSRHRKAILIGQAAIEKLKREHSLYIEDGPDGTGVLKS